MINSPASGKACPSSACITVIRNGNGSSLLGRSRHFGDMDFPPTEVKASCQIEITIIKITVPGDRDKRAAHESFNSTGIETCSEFLNVRPKISRG